jgi:hypothetical protein
MTPTQRARMWDLSHHAQAKARKRKWWHLHKSSASVREARHDWRVLARLKNKLKDGNFKKKSK